MLGRMQVDADLHAALTEDLFHLAVWLLLAGGLASSVQRSCAWTNSQISQINATPCLARRSMKIVHNVRNAVRRRQ